jgi:hypothetical protein
MKRLLTLLCIVLLATACRSTRKIGVAINSRKDSAQLAQMVHADSMTYIRQVMLSPRSEPYQVHDLFGQGEYRLQGCYEQELQCERHAPDV